MSTFRSVYSREGSQPSTPRANSISTRSSGNYSMFRDYSQHKIASTPPQPISPSLSNMYYTPQPTQNLYEPSTPRASSVSASHRGSCGVGSAAYNYESSSIGNIQNDNYRYQGYTSPTFENSPRANSVTPGSRLSGGPGISKMQAPASFYSSNYESTTPRASACNGRNQQSFQYNTPPQTSSQPVHMYYTPQPAQSLYEPSRERASSVGTSHRGGGSNCENMNANNNSLGYNTQSTQNEYLNFSCGAPARHHAPTSYYPGQGYTPVEAVIPDSKTPMLNQYSSRDYVNTSNLYSTPQVKPVTTNSPNVPRSPSSRRGGSRIRRPSMVHHPHAEMIHPQSPEYNGKLCVVLDLDETLVYSREGPVMQRPGCAEFLQSLEDIGAEVVVWTAGERDYAQDVLRRIDPNGIVQHCIYRHEKWWNGQAGYRKDLSNLGRQMDLVLFIDNTPDCLRGHENNSILVSDFTSKTRGDNVLYTLARVIRKYSQGSLPISNALASCEEIVRRNIKSDTIGNLGLFTLVSDTALESPSRQVRINRDLSSAAAAVASSAATRRSYRSTTPNPTASSSRAAVDTNASPLSSSSHTGWNRSVTPNMRSGSTKSSGSTGMSFLNSRNTGSPGSMLYQSSVMDPYQNLAYGYGNNQSPHLVDRYMRSGTPTNASNQRH